jgi:hypothetical protein
MENKTPAEIILDEIVQDGTGIEVTQDESLKFAKQIAELAWSKGFMECSEWFGGERYPEQHLDKGKKYYESKEQFIKELFNTK